MSIPLSCNSFSTYETRKTAIYLNFGRAIIARRFSFRSRLRPGRHTPERLNAFLRRLGRHCVSIGMVRVNRKPAGNGEIQDFR